MKINIDTNQSVSDITMSRCASKLKELDGVNKALLEYQQSLISRFEDLCKEKTGFYFKCSDEKHYVSIPKEGWKEGDIVKCLESTSECFTAGREYVVCEDYSAMYEICLIDDEGDEYTDPSGIFEFVCRP